MRQKRYLSCPNCSTPAVPQSSSAAPKGMSWICLRPSLISNSSPGLRPSWAVQALPTSGLPLNWILVLKLRLRPGRPPTLDGASQDPKG